MVGGRQNLSLSENGSGVGTAIHEIGHALGLKHEQCRADRDEYIVVYYDNIKSDRRHNFDKVSGSAYKTSAAFDYSSVMIYNSYITDPNFVRPTKPVMLTKEGVAFSRSYTPTDLDVQAINEMYRKKVCTINARSECSLSGSVTGNKGYSYLSACVLRAVPAQNRYFSGWYEDGKRLSTLNPYTFSVTGEQESGSPVRYIEQYLLRRNFRIAAYSQYQWHVTVCRRWYGITGTHECDILCYA